MRKDNEPNEIPFIAGAVLSEGELSSSHVTTFLVHSVVTALSRAFGSPAAKQLRHENLLKCKNVHVNELSLMALQFKIHVLTTLI